VFLGQDGRLVLGDAGIAYFYLTDDGRLTETYEKVGTYDWMAPWLVGGRSALTPAADLFSLGKLLWWMLAGRHHLPFWEHRDAENDLEKLFPQDANMRRINTLLDGLLVRHEASMTIKTARELQSKVDSELEYVRLRVLPPNRCHSCGAGSYK